MYNGIEIFDEYIKAIDSHKHHVGGEDNQECYLGYNPDDDLFYMGFDIWGEVGMSIYSGDNVLIFKFLDDKLKFESSLRLSNHGEFYRESLSKLHDLYPSLVDLRLD